MSIPNTRGLDLTVQDCRVSNGNTPEYRVLIDGKWSLQNRMFSRADMSFWGFTAGQVEPPAGQALEFWALGRGEPHFEPVTAYDMLRQYFNWPAEPSKGE